MDRLRRCLRLLLVALTASLLWISHSSPIHAVLQNPPPDPAEPSYVPGELVVGFKTSGPSIVNVCVHCLRAFSRSFFSATTDASSSLDALYSRFNVYDIEAVFRSPLEEAYVAGAPGTLKTLSALQDYHDDQVDRARARYPQRTARAPQNYTLPDLSHTYLLHLPPQTDLEAAAEAFRQDPHVAFAQPNYVGVGAFAVPPDDTYADPDRNGTWSSGAWGQSFHDLWGLLAMNVEDAWTLTRGAGVVVGVVDSGANYTHEDLQANIWMNPCEDLNHNGVLDISDLNSLDDPCPGEPVGNGFVNDFFGWDFKNSDNDPADENGHGTHVAGTIAAVGNNGKGIVGVAPEARVLLAKAIGGSGAGFGSLVDLGRAIQYAALNGADVINNSWSCGFECTDNQTANPAVMMAYGLGSVVVFAAGNYFGADVLLYSPQNLGESITVAAATPQLQPAAFTNIGDNIAVAAPGGGSTQAIPGDCDIIRDILSLRSPGTGDDCLSVPESAASKYIRNAGTSMAAPHASGVAALILGHTPTWKNQDVRRVMEISADSEFGGIGRDPQSGAGLLDAAAALDVDTVPTIDITSPAPRAVVQPGTTVTIRGTAKATGFDHYQLLRRRVDDLTWTTIRPPVFSQIENGILGSWNTTGLFPGPYFLKLLVEVADQQQFADVAQVILQGTGQALTSDPSHQMLPAISGDRIVWVDSRVNPAQLFTCLHSAASRTCTARQVTAAPARPVTYMAPAISGNRILWRDSRTSPDRLFVCDVNEATGTCPQRQVTTSAARPAEFAIDGTLITWTDTRSAMRRLFACVYDPATGACPEVALTTNAGQAFSPALWGPHIAWVDTRHGTRDLFLCTFDSVAQTCPAQPLTTGAQAFNPSISGHRVVWQDSRGQPGGIYKVFMCAFDPATGTCPEQPLTPNPGIAQSPAIWGDFIVWKNDQYEILIYDVRDGSLRSLSPDSDNQDFPAITQGQVVWQQLDDPDWNIYAYQLPPVNTFPRFIFAPRGPQTFREGPRDHLVPLLIKDPEGVAPTVSAKFATGAALSTRGCGLLSLPLAIPGAALRFFTCSPPVDTVTPAQGSLSETVVVTVSDGSLRDWRSFPLTIVEHTPTLMGQVRQSDGDPIPFVTVKLSGTTDAGAKVKLVDLTNAAGYYQFAGLAPGTYELEPRAQGYDLAPDDLAGLVWPAATAPTAFIAADDGTTPTAVPGTQAIAGTITDAQGLPVAGARLYLKASTTVVERLRVRLVTVTDADGYYHFDDLPQGTYYLKVRAPQGRSLRLTPASQTLELTTGPLTQVNFGEGP